MSEWLSIMSKPLLACLILTGIHAYLGIHVVERKVIFVDLALAQIAALGATLALVFNHDLHGNVTYWCSLTATFIGAVIFALTRSRKESIPHEAVIGIVYAVAAAFAVLVLSRSAEGDEHIRHILVGDILLVTNQELVKMAILYSFVGFFHWIYRRRFLMISMQPQEAFRQKVNVKGWDLLFYITFGIVVTSSVQIAGVLLVFSFLIVPSVAAMIFSSKISTRLWIAWGVGVAASFFGLAASYEFDFPTGATVVCSFGFVLLLLIMMKNIFLSNSQRGQC